ncbi:hypothetical protein EKD04_002035 [Chloroflexales bacterium ZM16-3]|nr:hypothetical protein [Chloroflexales bacterium ZM16-3]
MAVDVYSYALLHVALQKQLDGIFHAKTKRTAQRSSESGASVHWNWRATTWSACPWRSSAAARCPTGPLRPSAK